MIGTGYGPDRRRRSASNATGHESEAGWRRVRLVGAGKVEQPATQGGREMAQAR